jgi:HSP20 family molecular chaperone IbpA
MSLFYPNFDRFSPLFRLADELDRATRQSSQVNRRSFAPRFDMKEQKESYELQGELPGIERSNINIEWSDDNTLVICGHTEKSYEYNSSEAAEVVDGSGDEASKRHSTVENEGGSLTSLAKESENKEIAKAGENTPRYWITERSTGSFHRTFQFPTSVDHEAVKASLENGILNISVPKAKAKEPRKIAIQ